VIYKKLEKELHDKRKDMANYIAISNVAYEERDKMQNELAEKIQSAEAEQ